MSVDGPPEAPDDQRLFEPGTSAPLLTYAKRLWKSRHYAVADAQGKLESTYSENTLGRLWLFLEPTLFVGIYFLMFGVLLDASRGLGDADFLAYLAVGKLTYGFLRRAITGAAVSLTSDQAIVDNTSLPVATYPLVQLLKAALAYRYELVVMLVFVLLRGIRPRVAWLLLPPIALLSFGVALGAGLILVRMVSRFSDIRSALPQLMLFGMYASGVIFPIEQYILGRQHDTLILRVLAFNPMYAIVKVNQWAAIDYTAPEFGWVLVSALMWSALLPVAGLAWFIRGERRFSSAIYTG